MNLEETTKPKRERTIYQQISYIDGILYKRWRNPTSQQDRMDLIFRLYSEGSTIQELTDAAKMAASPSDFEWKAQVIKGKRLNA